MGMSNVYRIFGAEMSPYSVKVRAYARFKGLPHKWLNRGGENAADYAKYAKIQIVPLVVTPEGEGIQDSTPIIERLEAQFPSPSIHPDDKALRFLSDLLEELADEWGNKWMFHYRWRRPIDQQASAGRLALAMNPAMDDATQQAFAQQYAHDGPRVVCRVERRDGTLHRKHVPDGAQPARRASCYPALPLWCTPLVCRFFAVGTGLQYVDRPDAVRPDRSPRAECSRLDPAHALAAHRG